MLPPSSISDGQQLSLFSSEVVRRENMRIREVASELGVSIATVRNWIKTGLLSSEVSGTVTVDSLNYLKLNRLGSSKLVARANKLKKTSHDGERASTNFLLELDGGNFDDSIVGEYERSLDESYRNKEGIYYTDSAIVEDMLRGVVVTDSTTFLDPCCGCGNFIIGAIDRGVKVGNIYGFDTDSNAVEITKRRIFAKTGIWPENIICADFLSEAKSISKAFDLIYTNPPWGKKIAKAQKDAYARLYRCGESVDTCSLFAFASLSLLAEGGRLGFLLPEAFLNIASFQSLRRRFLETAISEIKDYGRPFERVMTKAYSIIIENRVPSADSEIICMGEERDLRAQFTLGLNPKSIFNIWATGEEQKVINTLLGIPHLSLEGNAEWGLGIVTGDNKEKCKPEYKPGLVPIFRGKDISIDGLAAPEMFIDPDLSTCQQVAPLEMYNAPEKIIYRFISGRLVFFVDKEQRLILNSANMLILHPDFPLNSNQLASLLNSEIMNFLFAKVFNTHKVLRGDLELLPIFTSCFEGDEFDEQRFLNQYNIEKLNGTFRIKGTNL